MQIHHSKTMVQSRLIPWSYQRYHREKRTFRFTMADEARNAGCLLRISCSWTLSAYSTEQETWKLTIKMPESIAFRHFFYSISAFLFHLIKYAQKWFLPFSLSVAKLEFWPKKAFVQNRIIIHQHSRQLFFNINTMYSIYSPIQYISILFLHSSCCVFCLRWVATSITL